MSLSPNETAERARDLERWLLKEFGPVLTGRPLRKLLGLTTPDAFRQGLRRGLVAVPLFLREGRKGWCAHTRDVARWIALSEISTSPVPPEAVRALSSDDTEVP